MKTLLFILSALLMLSCNRAQPVANTNTSERPPRSERTQDVTAHTTENQTPRPANSNTGKWSQSGDPIDTEKFDAAIREAEQDLKAKPTDTSKKSALADAFFDRGFALTEARQYASALGDYRRALKYDPNHQESKKWIDQIVSIYSMLKKEPPVEGEEPPPLPFKKTA
jgi:tetratricopeptide (TPR) repeat protein